MSSSDISDRRDLLPIFTSPAAAAISVAVLIDPPNRRLRSVSCRPTLSGPISIGEVFTMLPPPRAIDNTSGILKFVLIPPISTAIDDSLGNPFRKIPTSVEVPPISATIAF